MPYFPLFSLHIALVEFYTFSHRGRGGGQLPQLFHVDSTKTVKFRFFIYVFELMLVVISFTVSAKAGSTRIFFST